jgi:hypothetical protein
MLMFKFEVRSIFTSRPAKGSQESAASSGLTLSFDRVCKASEMGRRGIACSCQMRKDGTLINHSLPAALI